jgi:hypothetical protein
VSFFDRRNAGFAQQPGTNEPPKRDIPEAHRRSQSGVLQNRTEITDSSYPGWFILDLVPRNEWRLCHGEHKRQG